jgi:uncharacterized integral membrane protein
MSPETKENIGYVVLFVGIVLIIIFAILIFMIDNVSETIIFESKLANIGLAILILLAGLPTIAYGHKLTDYRK